MQMKEIERVEKIEVRIDEPGTVHHNKLLIMNKHVSTPLNCAMRSFVA